MEEECRTKITHTHQHFYMHTHKQTSRKKPLTHKIILIRLPDRQLHWPRSSTVYALKKTLRRRLKKETAGKKNNLKTWAKVADDLAIQYFTI